MKTSKKTIVTVIIVILISEIINYGIRYIRSINSSNNIYQSLPKNVLDMNKTLPKDYKNGTILDSCAYVANDTTVKLYYTLNTISKHDIDINNFDSAMNDDEYKKQIAYSIDSALSKNSNGKILSLKLNYHFEFYDKNSEFISAMDFSSQ